MELTGTIRSIGNEEVVSEKFKKREFILTDNSSQYAQHIAFQLCQDKCELIDNFSLGDTITVHFNLRGRLWVSPKGEEKYFNTLDAWRIDGDTTDHKDNKAEIAKPINNNSIKPDDSQDLPF